MSTATPHEGAYDARRTAPPPGRRHAGQDPGMGPLSDYVDSLADSMKRLSGDLREKTGDQLLQDAGRIARENPALFVTGGLAVGFGLSRFAKLEAGAHGQDRHGTRSDRSDHAARADGLDRPAGDAVAVEMPSGRTLSAEQAGEVPR